MNNMTKKDFELISDVIKDSSYKWKVVAGSGSTGRKYQERIAEVFADALQETNTRFNRDKFLIACGIDIQYPCLVCDKVTNKPACDDCDKLVSTL
jgi:hypothetical protein